MNSSTSETLKLDPALQAQVSALVEAQVSQRVAGLEAQVSALQAQIKALQNPAQSPAAESSQTADKVNLLVFSNELDKLLCGFIVATGAAAMDKQVSMYFTFWGLTALKKETLLEHKTLPEKMMSLMLPKNADKSGLSKMNFMGLGTAFLKQMMKKSRVESLPDLIQLARELEIKMVACQMSMDVMGIAKDELIDDLTYGGVYSYLGDATESGLTLMV